MNTLIHRIIRENWRPGRAALAGLVATAAYSLVMEADMRITGNRYSDVRFIQGLLAGKSPRPQQFALLAWSIHFLLLLGLLYGD